ncbi:MAG: phospho-N-acetylmuramoyl-pentapeptide-transferase [Cryomorphaceae bacterium]|nr:phospho-N-acetylmuramoyl-pentapeptide-transferase [Cryomorphaceae bacterium]|tara:strand:- start:18360 stop:19586 length:1227 start_codon:yes stop_codon:yes gene_type:complete
MLYELFKLLDKIDFPGAGLFEFLTFRAALAILGALAISLIFGGKLINILKEKQIGESVRDLGLDGQIEKSGTPTMGGLIILSAIIVPVLLVSDLGNIYIKILLLTTIWMGAIGFADDYIKVFKKNKKGLRGYFKVIGQITLGVIIGLILSFHPDVTMKEEIPIDSQIKLYGETEKNSPVFGQSEHSLKTTIPFFKDATFDYRNLLNPFGINQNGWIIFIVIVIFIITAVSNGANLTDGLDGLAGGTSAIIAFTLAILAYVSGSVVFASYLDIMYIPNSGELVVFAAAFIGACIGFLWYNTYPAQVFMGDTGSLSIGAIIAVFAIAIRKELLIPILAGVFLIENLSVIIQVSYFKYSKKRYGQGKRVFLMSPLHHHFQKKGIHESKIATRFWIFGIFLAIFTLITLKLR